MTRWLIEVSRCFNFHPDSTNSTSYESWHFQLKFETSVRSLMIIVWSQEVSEWPRSKWKKTSLAKNLKSPIFVLHKFYIPQKNPHKNRHSYLKQDLRFLLKKSRKKNWFCDFRSQKTLILYWYRLDFWKTCQDSKKMTSLHSSWDIYG